VQRLRALAPVDPFDPALWRSPLRGPWLASFLSVLLLVLFLIDLLTGYLSNAAYQPSLAGNSITGGGLDADLYFFDWPTHPAWLYAFTQGAHITAGVAAVPILAAKLWVVMPKLYKWPPARTPVEALDRLTLALLVGSSILLLVTGVFNIAYWYPWHFSFVTVHYYCAFVFVGSIFVHVAAKLPTMTRAFRERGVLRPLREGLAETLPELPQAGTTAPTHPAVPSLTRRGLLGMVGASSLSLVLLLVGESVGGVLRKVALLAPRGRQPGTGPNGFQVNKTAVYRGITPLATGAAYRLSLHAGDRTVALSRAQLLAMTQYTYDLPISCVEGWSTTQRWTGVRLADLAGLAGAVSPHEALVESIQQRGAFASARLNHGQLADHRSLLALKVNGVDLSPDHGFPARVIVPAAPGVHLTKWVRAITFAGTAA